VKHLTTTLALASSLYIGGFFGWRMVQALLADASAWQYGVGLFALVVLMQSVGEPK
jgi:hypothetical protein